MKKLTAYVDGSYDKSTGVYGYGVVLLEADGKKNMRGYGSDTEGIWQVAGELAGAKSAIRYARENGYDAVHICYDYEGIEKWASGEWKAKKRSTKEYVEFVKLARGAGLTVTYEKVAAHTGVQYNEEADALAKSAVQNGIAAFLKPALEEAKSKAAACGSNPSIRHGENFLAVYVSPDKQDEARKDLIRLLSEAYDAGRNAAQQEKK